VLCDCHSNILKYIFSRLKDARAGASAAVYGALLSAGPMMKYSSTNGCGKVAKAVSSAIGEHAVHGVTSLLTMYADQGLAGMFRNCIF
jgi:hypothetical protein